MYFQDYVTGTTTSYVFTNCKSSPVAYGIFNLYYNQSQYQWHITTTTAVYNTYTKSNETDISWRYTTSVDFEMYKVSL